MKRKDKSFEEIIKAINGIDEHSDSGDNRMARIKKKMKTFCFSIGALILPSNIKGE